MRAPGLLLILLWLVSGSIWAQEPTTPEGLVKRGTTRFDADNLDGARAWGVSGWIKWIYLDKPALALRDLNRALELGHKAEDYRTRAYIFRDMGQPDRAEADLRDGLKVVGGNSELRGTLVQADGEAL